MAYDTSLTDSSAWCALPWFHKAVQTDGTVKPCCSWKGPSQPDADDWLSGSLPTDLRLMFGSGMPAAECANCVMKERSGNGSWRRLSFDMADDAGLHALSDHSLRSVEVNLSNVCNLRCRTCNGDSSSRWVADEIEMGLRPPGSPAMKKSGWRLSDHDAKTIRLVEFLGGEPLLHQDEMVENLSRVDDLSRLRLTLTTNGTVAMGRELADLLVRCQRVHVNVSVDGLGSLNDYIRSDSSWSDVAETLLWLDGMALENENFNYGICSVYSVLNCNLLPDLWEWYDGQGSGLSCHRRQAIAIPLIGPYFYDVKNLPDWMKSRLTSRLLVARDRMPHRAPLVDGLVDYLNMDGVKDFREMRGEFASFNGYLDRTRSAYLRDVNPEIDSLMG